MSRLDDIGFMWEDHPVIKAVRGERRTVNVAPPVTGWRPPTEFPNLRGVKLLGLDTETKDPLLREKGPGTFRGDSHIVGVSVATDDRSWYFPIRHEYEAERALNLDAEHVLAWLREEVAAEPRAYVGANVLYDLEHLRAEGVEFAHGTSFHDVQFAEALIDEEARSYALDVIARTYLGEGKGSDILYAWCAQSFGGEVTGSQRRNIWRAPPSLVGPYAEADARLPLQVLQAQWPLLERDELLEVYELESALIPLLLDMRFAGVRVDVQRAERVLTLLREKASIAHEQLNGINVWANEDIAAVLDAEGLPYERSATGRPSFTKEWLATCKHPIARLILEARMYEKAANPFVESYLLENAVKGRVHGQFHPLRSDSNGTVSGRFSSSNPNLQNIPSRDEVLAPMLRGLFIPEQGAVWVRTDYSQIEYRLLVELAVAMGARGATEMLKRYEASPDTDFHVMTMELVREITRVELARKPAKGLNFGLVYGMGRDKLIASLGVSRAQGNRLYEAYFAALPAVKTALKMAMTQAQYLGYVQTILGRRKRFSRMEEGFDGQQQRAFTHKALNSILQGSAADVMKRAMVRCYEAGLLFTDDVTTHLTVHDELDLSVHPTRAGREALREIKALQEAAVETRVPLLVDVTEGKNWGECR